jgi:hypothetical protein
MMMPERAEYLKNTSEELPERFCRWPAYLRHPEQGVVEPIACNEPDIAPGDEQCDVSNERASALGKGILAAG